MLGERAGALSFLGEGQGRGYGTPVPEVGSSDDPRIQHVHPPVAPRPCGGSRARGDPRDAAAMSQDRDSASPDRDDGATMWGHRPGRLRGMGDEGSPRTKEIDMHATARRPLGTRRGLLGAVALLGTAAVTGCTIGSGDPDAGGTGEDGTGEDAASDGGGADTGEGSEGGGEQVVDEGSPVDLDDLPPAVASGTVPATVDGDPDAALTVSLHELRRDEKRVIALFSFLVESTEEDEAYWLYDYLGAESWEPYLIDPVNLTKHLVLRDGAEAAMTDSQVADFRPGQTLRGYAMFAAPPEDVTAMDVMLVEGATIATGIEIR